MNTAASTEPLPLDTLAWYAWEPESAESNWLLTYVDMLSVVLAMLVVLLGHMAAQQLQAPQPDARPVAAVETTVETTAEPVTDAIAEPRVEPAQTAIAEPLAEQRPDPVAMKPDEVLPEPVEAVDPNDPVDSVRPETTPPPATESVSPEDSPEARLAAAIEAQFQGEIRVVERDHGISLEIAEVILFDSAKADLLKEAEPVLARLVQTLQAIGEADVSVEGHTDDRPILGGRFQSNWELGAARANAVTRYLLSQGFSPNRLRSVSYADTHPVADNRTEAGRAANRRVNLKVEFL